MYRLLVKKVEEHPLVLVMYPEL